MADHASQLFGGDMDVSERHEAKAKYMPTPEQIKADCLEIQKTWSEGERMRRSAPARPVDMTVVHRVVDEEE